MVEVQAGDPVDRLLPVGSALKDMRHERQKLPRSRARFNLQAAKLALVL
jgi:hypothetical protein